MKGNNQPPNDSKKKKKNSIDILNYIEEFKLIDEKKINKNEKINKNNKKLIKGYIKEELENYYNPLKNSNSQNSLTDLIKTPIENIKENIRKSKSYNMLEDLVKQINNENIIKKSTNDDSLLNKINYLYIDCNEILDNSVEPISKLKKNSSSTSLNDLPKILENNQISINELNNFMNDEEKLNDKNNENIQTNKNNQNNQNNQNKKKKNLLTMKKFHLIK